MLINPSRRQVAWGALLCSAAASVAQASNRSVWLDIQSDGWRGLDAWSAELSRRAGVWWPVMAATLASAGFRAPDVVHIRFIDVTPEVVARLSGTPFYRRLDVHARNIGAITRNDTISVNAPFVLARVHDPEMLGMMAHELAHVVQSYPHGVTTWLAEGIADYVRFYVLMPDDPGRRFDPARTSYDSGYHATAGLLDWVERIRPGSVREINAAMRRGADGPSTLTGVAGATPPILWRAYLDSAPAAARGEGD